MNSTTGLSRNIVCARRTRNGAFKSNNEYWECWKYRTHDIMSKIPEITAMTQKNKAFVALRPYSPDSANAPIKTTKIKLTAPQKSEMANLPTMITPKAISEPMRRGLKRIAFAEGTGSNCTMGYSMLLSSDSQSLKCSQLCQPGFLESGCAMEWYQTENVTVCDELR